jgi:GNAT superfamily N-acetyltransferase
MLRVRTVTDINDFLGFPGDPENYADIVKDDWESGESKRGWCLLLEDGDERIGRVGFLVTPTTSDPRWLGSLPPTELSIYGLELPWDGNYLDAGGQLIRESLREIQSEVPDLLQVRINVEGRPFADARRLLMESLGTELFQEKQGFSWRDHGESLDPGDRLSFRSVSDVGAGVYRSVMSLCGENSLDRNDRYYWQGCGPDNWAAQMMVYLHDHDAPMWLVGYHDDVPVGYVAVGSDEAWGSTIIHIGVVPSHRGNGYIHDLIVAGTAAARRAGITSMLSDVDVLNQPMVSAMSRAGYDSGLRPWHTWVYRTAVSSVIGV